MPERKKRIYHPLTPEQKRRRNIRTAIKAKAERLNPAKAAKYIGKDTRHWDKRNGLEHDLTIEFISELIKDGCSYCGNKNMKMTADRIDNSIGHVKSNVVASCYRCNMIRGNMPYDAWLNVVPAIKNTFENGLFGEWIGGLKKSL